MAKFATYKKDENPATSGQSLAMKWALNSVANPGFVAAGILPVIVLDGSIRAEAAGPATIPDAEIQGAVEAAINRVLKSYPAKRSAGGRRGQNKAGVVGRRINVGEKRPPVHIRGRQHAELAGVRAQPQ